MKISFLILFTLLLNHKAFSFENELFLKAGVNFGVGRIGTFEQEEEDDDDKEIAGHNYFGSYGFNTHVGYRWDRFEISASSTIYFGKVEDLSFKIDQSQFTGSGNYQNVMIYPTVKYFIPWKPLDHWRITVGVSPIFSQQTVRLKEFVSNGPYTSDNFKLTYDSVGGGLSIGFEENLELKEMHPVYFEISYTFLRSIKSYLVDTTDPKKTNIISSQHADNDVAAEALIFSMGMVLF